MSTCTCKLCEYGRKLQALVDKYKMSKKDKNFLLNDVFIQSELLGEAEYAIERLNEKRRPK